MTQRLVQVYGYKKYKNANMLLAKSFDVFGDNRGVINSEPSFLKPEVSDDMIDLMNETGSPLYFEADVNKKNDSNLTKIDWASANLNAIYTDERDWLSDSVEPETIKETLGISYDSDEDFELPVGLDIPKNNGNAHIDADKPFFSALANGAVDSGESVFDKEAEDYGVSGLTEKGSVLVGKSSDDIHLMQYDSVEQKVNISDIKDLPDFLQANLRMTYLAYTKSLDELVILDNVHTNNDTLNDDLEKITDKADMPRIARDYLILTSDVKNPQGKNIDMAGIIDDEARTNGKARLAEQTRLKEESARKALLNPVDEDDIDFDF